MKYLFSLMLLLFSFSCFSKSLDAPDFSKVKQNDLSWNEWIIKIKKELEKERYNNSSFELIDDLSFNPRVIELDRKQPEFKLTFDQYLNKVLNDKKKRDIVKKFNENKNLLNKIQLKYNVDPKIIVALWGIETSFGKYTGKFNILRSLASLSYDGRRTSFFYKEFKNSLKILEQGHFSSKDFIGSWAGAFGQTQFMPSTFMNYAVDFDGDKKKNLFSKEDALASGANYLKKIGWDDNLVWGEKIDVKIDKQLKELSKTKKYYDLDYWEKMGINLNKEYEPNQKLRLVIPDSNFNDCYLVSKNFDVILGWNRSNYFALTVFLFSDEIL